jgi:hypothetical protein
MCRKESPPAGPAAPAPNVSTQTASRPSNLHNRAEYRARLAEVGLAAAPAIEGVALVLGER